MINTKVEGGFNNMMLSIFDRSITDKQRTSINRRLNKSNVKLHSVYRHKKYDVIVLGCINTNLQENKPFYFLYWDNGNEVGRGYDFMNGNDSYVMLVNFEENKAI